MSNFKNIKDNYENILRLGLTKVNEKKYDESKDFFSNLIKIDQKRYEGYLNLSNILVIEKKNKEANELLKKYLLEVDTHPEIINGLAINLFNQNYLDELSAHIDLYFNKHQNYLLNYLKGYCLNIKNNSSKSESFLKKSIEMNNSFWPSYELLFNIYDRRSLLKEMKELIIKSQEFFSDSIKLMYFEALYFYRNSEHAKSHNILLNKKLVTYFENRESSSFLSDYYDLISKNYGKLLDYKLCLHYALKRNKCLISLDKNKSYKKEDLLTTINSYTKFFDPDTTPKHTPTNFGLEHSNLAFLIGFPRSGTTLLDTILRTHSKTLVLEEEPYLLNLRHDFYKKNKISSLLNLDNKTIVTLQEKYFRSFSYDPNKTIIDKFPLNLIELGFIKTIFPNSKIILAIRHPLDCILSCVLTAFKINEAMLNFENLETTAFFYNKSFDLLIKYIEFYNIEIHKIKYEDVVLDFDNQIHKLLNFLDLKFENSITSFYDTAKKREKIHTPSYDQVVKPLYSSSINRHINYDEIKFIASDVKKWIDYFSYK